MQEIKLTKIINLIVFTSIMKIESNYNIRDLIKDTIY